MIYLFVLVGFWIVTFFFPGLMGLYSLCMLPLVFHLITKRNEEIRRDKLLDKWRR